MYLEFGAVFIFLALGVVFVVANLFLGSLLRRTRPGGSKETVYECGEPTIGSSWIRYNSRFYNVALVYLLFDVEVVIAIPAALVLRRLAGQGMGMAPLLVLLAFFVLLVLGLAYEWFYGNLDWIAKDEVEQELQS